MHGKPPLPVSSRYIKRIILKMYMYLLLMYTAHKTQWAYKGLKGQVAFWTLVTAKSFPKKNSEHVPLFSPYKCPLGEVFTLNFERPTYGEVNKNHTFKTKS